MSLQLRKFDMRRISFNPNAAQGPTILMLGKRNTGKSFLISDLLFYNQDCPVGAVVSGTEAGNGYYGKMVPRIFVHNEYHPVIVENVLKSQKIKIKERKMELNAYKKSNIDPRSIFILDDCLFDNSWTRDKVMRFIFMNGRHWKIMMILTMQYPLGMPPILRSNIDYIFILRENITSNRKRIYDNYAGMFPTFEVFCQIMDQCTENYECLVIVNNADSNKLEDQVFWYKADPHPPFRLGAKEYWEMSEELESDDEDKYDPSKHQKKRNTQRINVKKESSSKW